MTDPAGVLEAPGDNSRSSRMINNFRNLDQIDAAAPARLSGAGQSRSGNQGLKVDLPKDESGLRGADPPPGRRPRFPRSVSER